MAYSDFCSPIAGAYSITSRFGPRTHPVTGETRKQHNGIDFGAPNGTQVFAIADGTVVTVRRAFEGSTAGEYITLEHDGTDSIAYSRYLHLYEGSTNHLNVGDTVEKGQEIGKVGNTGRSTGNHLHFELQDENSASFDPESFVISTSNGVDDNREGIYKDNTNSDEPPDPLSQTTPATVAPQQPTYTAQTVAEKQDVISKEDVEDSALAFFLSDVIEKRKSELQPQSSIQQPRLFNNIIYLNAENNTPFLHNLIFSKTFGEKGKDFSTLTTLELSNMVPYVELFAVKKGENGQQIEISYPFDDYTNKTKLESIFYDKTSRGGNIGIKSVDWKTLATNPSNLAQVSVKIKFYIQDIQDIESVRNGISLLDFLYPAGSRNSDEYDPANFNIKLKLGWLYKSEANSSLSEIDKKIRKDELSECIYATLYKHEFEFLEDGGVELVADYIGMIETQISNINTHNILDKLNPNKKGFERIVNSWKLILAEMEAWGPEAITKLSNNSLTKKLITLKENEQLPFWQKFLFAQARSISGGTATIPEVYTYITLKNLPDEQEDLQITLSIDGDVIGDSKERIIKLLKDAVTKSENNLQNSYKAGLSNLLDDLASNNKINYLLLSQQEIESLIKISMLPKEITEAQLESLRQDIAYVRNSIYNQNNKLEPQEVNEAITAVIQDEDANGRHIDSTKFLENLSKTNNGNSYIPYTFLGDIVSYYVRLFYNERSVVDNNDLRIVLGSFSYRDIGNLDSEKNVYAGGSARNNDRTLINQDIIYKTLSSIKKYANLADIPISLKSIIQWYNTKILDADLSKLSFHSFMKNLLNDLVASNLSNDIAPYISNRNIISSFNYLTVTKDQIMEQELQNSFLDNGFYQVNFSGEAYKKSTFYKLKTKQLTQEKIATVQQKINYMFVLSTNERSSDLTSDYQKDLDRFIYHFYTGEDKGLIKRIKFARDDNKQLDAANIIKVNNGEADSAIIRRIYHLTLEMFGNTIFEPGMLFHVSPTFPGARLRSPVLYDIGLGGYYRVHEITNYIEQEQFKTELKAHWQLYGTEDRAKDENEIFRVVDEED